jgi:serine/threonine-protein kinase
VVSVLGSDQATATATLEDIGLKVNSLFEYSATVPAGLVTRTEPAPGTPATEGDAITIYISQGPEAPPVSTDTGTPGGIVTQPADPAEGY